MAEEREERVRCEDSAESRIADKTCRKTEYSKDQEQAHRDNRQKIGVGGGKDASLRAALAQ